MRKCKVCDEEIKDGDSVEIRLWARPDKELTGTVLEHLPAGGKDLPSQALGYGVGQGGMVKVYSGNLLPLFLRNSSRNTYNS